MDTEWVLRVVLFAVLHWVLAIMLLQDLASRKRVFGGHKAPWAIMIIFLTFIGSLLYLLFHPQVFTGEDDNR